MQKVLVVYNINAGRKKSIKYKKKLQKFLLKNAESFKFISIDELENFDASLYDTIVAMGGDGTVNKVLPYLKDKVLGIIPCGTANLLAEKLGISTSFDKALCNLKQGKVKRIDLMNVNNKLASLRFGTGFDSNIICKTPQSLKQKFGYFAYFVAGILFALRLKLKEYTICFDDKEIKTNASCIIVANAGNMFKNLFAINPKSSIEDGLMDIFILKTTNPIILFFEIIKMFFNMQKSNRNALYFQVKNLTIQNKGLVAHIDGEKNFFNENINISINQNQIKIITREKV